MFSLVGRTTSSSSGVHGVSSASHTQSLDGALISKIAHLVLGIALLAHFTCCLQLQIL